MSRKFIAAILSMSLAVTAFSARPASALTDDDAAKLLFGAAALFIVGKAIHDSNDAPSAVSHNNNTYQPMPRPLPDRARNNRVLPAGCLRTFNTYDGPKRMLGKRCLKVHYSQVKRLPKECKTRANTRQYGVVKGYKPRCLRHNGFRLSNR